ncbi:hypothetical protein N7532_011317 [Penicillium argentinense]|uniref:PSI domain-containing protein n=1 Tax=Penicillium argentinense TaxID=1131581 RepID=A0A9W9JUD4_9EURO|nr:uncharacterized protein N7532_011317 [Penicillium argentinense]KAJ5082274.1 hypothetical protein N7532_011317 [Penicillium argentinense]
MTESGIDMALLEEHWQDQPRNHSVHELEPLGIETSDPLFHVCWRRQSCSYCLAGDVACSWCATSSACVPNSAHLPILAPIHATQICPLGSKERWELRALPFGCNVSTMTFLSVVVAVVGTVALAGIGFAVYWLVRAMRQRWKEADNEQLSEAQPSWWEELLMYGALGSLATLFLGQGQDQQEQGQPSTQSLADEAQDDGETRPLLEDM